VQSVGVEYDGALAALATRNVVDRGLQDKVRMMLIDANSWIHRTNLVHCCMYFTAQITILHANVLDVNISSASALFVYLVPDGMRAVGPTLVDRLRHGARIVTYGTSAIFELVLEYSIHIDNV
jgi:hypothetical protein